VVLLGSIRWLTGGDDGLTVCLPPLLYCLDNPGLSVDQSATAKAHLSQSSYVRWLADSFFQHNNGVPDTESTLAKSNFVNDVLPCAQIARGIVIFASHDYDGH
jgi:hypothetical protein